MAFKILSGHYSILLFLFLNPVHTSGFQCLNCRHFNKEDNPHNPCPMQVNQCGKCSDGFHAIDQERCEELDYTENIPNVVGSRLNDGYPVQLRQNLTISCNMKKNVDCAWLRNNQQVEIDGRYSYSHKQQGLQTKDCSLHISDIQTTDLATWQCAGMGGSDDPGFLANPVWIYERYYLVVHPQDHKVHLGGIVNLTCQLQTNVDCFWTRQDSHVEIDGRYKYLNSKDGKNSTDCSIEISNITMVDITYWQCGSMATSQNPGAVSQKVWILKIMGDPLTPNSTRPTLLTHPVDQKVHSGTYTVLNCIFNERVRCVWMQNGTKIEGGYRFKYVTQEVGINVQDCSLNITSVTWQDRGYWQCSYLANNIIQPVASNAASLKITNPEDSSEQNSTANGISAIIVVSIVVLVLAALVLVFVLVKYQSMSKARSSNGGSGKGVSGPLNT